ncbi:Endonuclease/exonuclease/phosphatase [Testicularia cyperi]|uniref:Endonuclease/exonuclease/phosphatase n=1 Tax=Testicularia cyperi TaxID=1882483 RepID=A0A317XV31_9BASI|nr:Endonuclease/exonuclease/phosphatase [Testicularia cyperi]
MSSSAASSTQQTSSNESIKAKGKKPNKPTPEEIEAKRQARAAKREREAAEKVAKEAELAAAIAANGKIPNGHLDEHGNTLFIPRDWASVQETLSKANASEQRIKIVSWNILAQGLVRRTLFPGSDCLKFKDRSVGLSAELSSRTGHGWDVGCFQEVDRMDVHGEMLEKDGFSYVYEKGYRQKQHGLLIAWRSSLFGTSDYSRKVIDLDAESVSDSSEATRTACSRVTRNIGLFVALQYRKDEETAKPTTSTGQAPAPGIVVATTHLFWHPMHAYERARQSGILVRRLNEYRESLGDAWSAAPCVFAGDFNDQPHSATYHLLTGKTLAQHCIDELQHSTVIHKSIDERRERGNVSNGFSPGTTKPAQDIPKEKEVPSNGNTNKEATESGKARNCEEDEEEDDDLAEIEEGEDEEEEGGGGADDQMLKNCRAATVEDGLLSLEELIQLHDIARPRPAPGSTRSEDHDSTLNEKESILERIQRACEQRTAALGSCYGLYYGRASSSSEEGNFFGSPERGRERWDDANWTPETPNCHTGDCKEPMWTIFSSLFSLTLDYIFLLPQKNGSSSSSSSSSSSTTLAGTREVESYPVVTRLLRTHKTETLQPGVPRKGVCASDHVAIGAEIEL